MLCRAVPNELCRSVWVLPAITLLPGPLTLLSANLLAYLFLDSCTALPAPWLLAHGTASTLFGYGYGYTCMLLLCACRELPTSASEVWFESADGAYRWRQTASTILLQLHALPDYITSAKQLSVTIEPYTLRVQEKHPDSHVVQSLKLAHGRAGVPDHHQGQAGGPELHWGHAGGTDHDLGLGRIQAQTDGPHHHLDQTPGQPGPASASGELLFEAELARGIVPEDSTWVFVKPDKHVKVGSGGGGFGSSGAGWTAAMVPATVVGSALLGSSGGSSGSGCHVLFELTKMNLELYER